MHLFSLINEKITIAEARDTIDATYLCDIARNIASTATAIAR